MPPSTYCSLGFNTELEMGWAVTVQCEGPLGPAAALGPLIGNKAPFGEARSSE